MIAPEALSQIASQHDRSMLDEELNRLPDKYRLPLFLCCVEGLSRDEAATQLGLSAGAVKGRLERGRQLLRRRLMLRGVSLSVAIGLMLGLEQTTRAAHTVTPSLIAATAEAGSRYAVGKSAAGIVSQNALTLANGSCHIMSLTATKLVVSFLFILGALTIAGNSLPAPAVAGGTETVLLTAQLARAVDSENTLVFFQGDRQRERRSVEREGQRRSPEAEAGPRRSPEAAAGQRRSPEAEAGPRRSAEAEAQRDSNDALRGFKPQSEREAALYRMILQLQREVADLRRAVGQPSAGERDGDRPVSRRDGQGAVLADGWEKTKAGGVFRAYDKNGDQFVALDEWLAMTNGNVSAARKELQTERFNETKPGDDKKLSPAEFIRWWNGREGAAPRDREGGRSAEGDVGPRRSAEGPRDGEAPPRLNADERRQQRIFQSRDKNQDRKLSRSEFDSLFEGGDTSRMFAAADRTGDGSLSLEEFVDFRLRRRPTTDGDQPSIPSREGDRDR